MCTDDVAYQAFRAQSRNLIWQQAVLAKPLAERRLLAAQIRQMSETKKNAEGLSEISDVTEAGVAALWQQLPCGHEIHTLIHGHTHRPNTHQHQINEQTITRYVIQDWHNEIAGYLALDSRGKLTTHPL
jgi:UDP-2,3-diacylglucosamine hydrolase